MTIYAEDLLRDLREDHRNMSILLNLLEVEIDGVEDEGNPDFELLCDIMRYMTVYADAVHHPKEDLLYANMQARRPKLASGLDRVAHDHDKLAQLGQALRDDVEAAAVGAPVTRERLFADSRSYVRTLRRHMAWEEEDLFCRAQKMVSAIPEVAVDVADIDALDPLFGPQREHAFENLLHHIKNAQVAG